MDHITKRICSMLVDPNLDLVSATPPTCYFTAKLQANSLKSNRFIKSENNKDQFPASNIILIYNPTFFLQL
jgi:hypothetical protein